MIYHELWLETLLRGGFAGVDIRRWLDTSRQARIHITPRNTAYTELSGEAPKNFHTLCELVFVCTLRTSPGGVIRQITEYLVPTPTARLSHWALSCIHSDGWRKLAR
jgi:hypothetical protein